MKTWQQVWEEVSKMHELKEWIHHTGLEIECLFVTRDCLEKWGANCGTTAISMVDIINTCCRRIPNAFRDSVMADIHVHVMQNNRVFVLWKLTAMGEIVRRTEEHARKVQKRVEDEIVKAAAPVVKIEFRAPLNWHLTDKAIEETYRNATLQCHLCGENALLQYPNPAKMNALLCRKHFDQWCNQLENNTGNMNGYCWIEARKPNPKGQTVKARIVEQTDEMEWGVAPMKPLADRVHDAKQKTLVPKDAVRKEIERLGNKKVDAMLDKYETDSEFRKQAIPLLAFEKDLSYAVQHQQAEIEALVREIRSAVQRTLAEWKKCKHCGEDWEIREASEKGISIGHACLLAKDKGDKNYVQTELVPYTFSDDLLKRMRVYGIIQ